MKKFIKNMNSILLYLWQLPQNLLGFLLLAIYNNAKRVDDFEDVCVYKTNKMLSGVSLGKYIILHPLCFTDETTLKHEYGHCLQSRRLGWLYLIVIGLPSLLGNIYDRLFHKNWDCEEAYKWYYNQLWEKWADELGGVKRNFK